MKRYILLLIKISVSGILVYLIYLKVDWSQLAFSITQSNYLYLCLAISIGILFNILKFTKWYFLINAGGSKHSYWHGTKSYMLGNSLGIVTPLRAGDLGRALYFNSEHRTRIISLTIIDRLMELAVIFLLAIAGSFILINKAFGFLVVFLTVITFLILLSQGRIFNYLQRLRGGTFINNKIKKISGHFASLDKKIVTGCLMLSLIAFTLVILEFYVLVIAFEDISIKDVFLVAPLITISTVLPISIMGLGVREGISILLLSNYGISAGTGLSSAFLLFLFNNVSISIIGVAFLPKVKIFTKNQMAYDQQKTRS